MGESDRTTVAVEDVDGRPTVVTRPLPVVEVRRPSAKRGADEIREELDGPRCGFCDVPVGDDEVNIPTDVCGTTRVFPICKGHSEHPESWHRATPFDPERVRYCETCGDLATGARGNECFDCRTADVRTENDAVANRD